MIRYALKCENDHSFESWFQSAGAFESLKAGGHLTCAVCGTSKVEKALMAPPVKVKKAGSETPAETQDETPAGPLSEQNEAEKAIAALREKIEENSTYVGGSFAKEARAMHLGDAPERPIWGEAKAAEAKSLIEDGVPVAPLPFLPKQKAN